MNRIATKPAARPAASGQPRPTEAPGGASLPGAADPAAVAGRDMALDVLLEGFELRDVVSHLLRRAHFRAEEIFNERAGRFGLTPRQKALLIVAYRHPGANQSELAERIAIDRNTIAEMLSRMVKAGLLVRSKDPGDARSNRLYITPRGIGLLKEIMPVDRTVEHAVMETLPPEYRPLFVKCLKRMVGVDADE
jgi:DNA-binding MarR family transcriptional regulator